jgi:hypothetical protein
VEIRKRECHLIARKDTFSAALKSSARPIAMGVLSFFGHFISDFAVIADSARRRKQLQSSSNVGEPGSLATRSAVEVSCDALWQDCDSLFAFFAVR